VGTRLKRRRSNASRIVAAKTHAANEQRRPSRSSVLCERGNRVSLAPLAALGAQNEPLARLDFRAPDDRFRCLSLAYEECGAAA